MQQIHNKPILTEINTCAKYLVVDRPPDKWDNILQKRLIFPLSMLLTSPYTKMEVIIEFSVPKTHNINHFEKINTLLDDENYENMRI